MKEIISSITEYEEKYGTSTGYREQWGVLQPVLGQVYAADVLTSGVELEWKTFKIMFIDNRVALGLEQDCTSLFFAPEYRLFCAKTGWRYHDNRPFYRLQDLQAVIKMAKYQRIKRR